VSGVTQENEGVGGVTQQNEGVDSPEQRVVAGRYRLRRLLGQGSMGVVWEAYDELLHRPVAVKEVRGIPDLPEPEADELRERTLREARAIAVVSHPNVVTLHDVARENGEPVVVMEYLPARSLADVLRRFGAMEPALAAAVGDAVAAGLGAAHQAGITHRDVKPGNVLVTEDGRVKLTDFGIARNVSELTLTRTGITLGSPAYMAPEVAAGREVTPAADLWGLGATLFAAVEGRAPYDPDGPVLETLSAVVHAEVPAPSEGPLREVIAALMVKDPAERASLDDVRAMLRPLLPPPGTALYTVPEEEKPDEEEPAPPARPEVPEREPKEDAEEPVAALSAEPGPLPFGPVLAADPGPLPFTAPAPRPVAARRGRSKLAVGVLMTVGALVFLVAAGGGFALARTIGGKSVLPPPRVAPAQPTSTPVDELNLVSNEGNAATFAGEQGGGFAVPVPVGWEKFVQQRANPGLPNSVRVHFVAQDGTQQVTVERFPAFYPKFAIKNYQDMLRKAIPNLVEFVPITATGPPSKPEQTIELTYKNAEGVARGDTGSNRVTFALLKPSGNDLWIVAVTVPIEQEDTGRTKLYRNIAAGFQITG